MTFARLIRSTCLSAAAASLVLGLAAPGAFAAKRATQEGAAGNYDGVYSVEIITEQGTCDKAYRWSIAVADGHVSSTGDVVLDASGQIDRRGVVSLAFHRSNQVAHAAGQIKGTMGSGTWSSPTLQCGGRWRAEKRG